MKCERTGNQVSLQPSAPFGDYIVVALQVLARQPSVVFVILIPRPLVQFVRSAGEHDTRNAHQSKCVSSQGSN